MDGLAQSKTVDRVFVAQSMKSSGASSAEQFYVSVSRARETVTVYTDDKVRLAEAIRTNRVRLSAHELLKLPSAAKVLDPFESMLRKKAAIPAPEKVGQASQPEREKNVEKKRVLSRRMRQRMNPVYQAQINQQHRHGISL